MFHGCRHVSPCASVPSLKIRLIVPADPPGFRAVSLMFMSLYGNHQFVQLLNHVWKVKKGHRSFVCGSADKPNADVQDADLVIKDFRLETLYTN